MDVPAGYKRWRFHWFDCPACGHRDWRTFASIRVAREPVRMDWRYWCDRCATRSTLKQPLLPSLTGALILLLVGPVAFFVIYRAMLAGLRFEWLVIVFAAIWLAQPLVLLGITRWLYRYVPAT